MTTIFEHETEIGKCTCEPDEDGHTLRYAEPEFSIILAHTVAQINGHRGMLKIEQHCYLRRGLELPDQPWIKPEIILEPVAGTREEMVEMARRLHEQFAERVAKTFPEEYLV